jgi:hypothetical protein
MWCTQRASSAEVALSGWARHAKERELMRHRRLARAAAGLIAGTATIGLLALPAAAGTVNMDLVDGFVQLNDDIDDPITALSLLTNCTAPTYVGSATGTLPSGNISVTMSADVAVTGGRMTFNALVTGTYSGTAVTYTAGSATVVLRAATGCTVTTTSACTISSGTLTGFGTVDIVPPVVPLYLTVHAFDQLGDTTVTGTATACGALLAANGGRTTISGTSGEAVFEQ